MAEQVDRQHEALLVKASERVVELSDGGMDPTDALEKVARECSLNRGDVESVAFAYNTGRQLRQWRSNDKVLDKLAHFPLAAPEVVIERLYGGTPVRPAQTKSAAQAADEYTRPPVWLSEIDRANRVYQLKVASAAEKTAAAKDLKPVDDGEDRRVFLLKKAHAAVDQHNAKIAEYSRQASAAEDRVRSTITGLIQYFSKHAMDRLPFATVEVAARSWLEPAATKLLDTVYSMAKMADFKEVRAGDKTPVFSRPIDLTAAPFPEIAACLKAAKDVIDARDRLKSAKDMTEAVREEAFRPFAKAGALQSPQDKGADAWPEAVKAAGLLGSPAVGTAIGTMLGRTIGSAPKTKDDMIEDAWFDLEDPSHQNEIRKIRANTLLTSMLTDPEDPISGHDPEKVLKAYNDIAQIAPRTSESMATIGPLIRRRLAGHTEPFEAKELTDIEKGISQSKNPTPNTSILGNAPESILA